MFKSFAKKQLLILGFALNFWRRLVKIKTDQLDVQSRTVKQAQHEYLDVSNAQGKYLIYLM